MDRPYFEPWIRENYESGGIFCKKILVLGDSHYCSSSSKNCEGCGVARGISCIPDFTKKSCNQEFVRTSPLQSLSHKR